MKKIDAPLCARCADILRGTFTAIEERVRFGHERRECAWCQRNDAAAVYRLQYSTKNTK